MTRNRYGKGTAEYIGCLASEQYLQTLFADALKDAGLWQKENEQRYPVIIRKSAAEDGKTVWFYLNYSHETAEAVYVGAKAEYLLKETETLTGEMILTDERIKLQPWGIQILKEV